MTPSTPAGVDALTVAQVDEMLRRFGQTAAPARLEWSPTLCDGKRVTYAEAQAAVDALNAVLADSEPRWRIPERMELESTLDLTRYDPAVDPERFPDTKSGWYWTSTITAWSSDHAWVVGFGYGAADDYHRDDLNAFVRAVRSLPAGQ